MKVPLRQLLGDSHIAAVAIAVLLLRSFELGVRSLGQPLFLLGGFFVNVVAVRDIPSGTFTLGQWLTLMPDLLSFVGSCITFGAAWLLSRWVFGMSPFRSLTDCRATIARRNHA